MVSSKSAVVYSAMVNFHPQCSVLVSQFNVTMEDTDGQNFEFLENLNMYRIPIHIV